MNDYKESYFIMTLQMAQGLEDHDIFQLIRRLLKYLKLKDFPQEDIMENLDMICEENEIWTCWECEDTKIERFTEELERRDYFVLSPEEQVRLANAVKAKRRRE